MFKKYWALLPGLLLPLCSHAELRDPTKPDYPAVVATPTAPKQQAAKAAAPVLSAIWIAPNSKRATLNGVTAKEGETILNNVKIIKISQNQVVIKQNNNLKTLQLLPRPNHTP